MKISIFIIGFACAAVFFAIRFWNNRSRVKSLGKSTRPAFKAGKYGVENLFLSSRLNPHYWKTIANLRELRRPDVSFDGLALCFKSYPFEPAKVFPSGAITFDEVAEINLGYPPTVRLKCGDILFVPWNGKDALIEFINKYDFQVVKRGSIWDELLEPFLDTEQDQETIDRQFARLAERGLNRTAVDEWRRDVGAAMIAYNFGTNLWEWVNLGLYDVLIAQRACLGPTEFAKFYIDALDLAARDSIIQPQPYIPPSLTSPNQGIIESTLFSVLLDWYPHEAAGDIKDFGKRWEVRRAKIEQIKTRLASDLASAYSESDRRYHALPHIENCLSLLDRDNMYATHINEVRWAILFHDSIYDARRQDNETRSAEWACRLMSELKRPEDEITRVRRLILATAHAGDIASSDEALMLDIDCSILGSNSATFAEYERAIRSEYQWVPEHEYRKKRAEVLESFIGRKHIFHTALYRQRCEEPARLNLSESIKLLRSTLI